MITENGRFAASKSSFVLLSAASVFLGVGFTNQAATANQLVYSPFNYTLGAALDSQGNSSDIGFGTGAYGGAIWRDGSGSSAAGVNTVGAPLTYTDANGTSLAVSGNSAQLNLGGTTRSPINEGEWRDLSGELGNNGSSSSSGYAVVPPQTLWISFIAQVPSTETNYNYGGVELVDQNNGNLQGLFIGQTGTFPLWGMSNDNGSASAKSNLAFTKKAFLVAEINLGGAPFNSVAGGDAVINLWQNPLLGSAPPATPNATISAGVNFQFNQIVLASGAPISFGDIRIGTTWADVTPVPDPAPLALLGTAGMGFLLLRRRNRQSRRAS